MPLPEMIATVVMGSQKSAPVAVTVIGYLDVTLSQAGLLTVPCVAGQICQIFIGSAMAPFLAKRMENYKAVQLEEVEAAKVAALENGDGRASNMEGRR